MFRSAHPFTNQRSLLTALARVAIFSCLMFSASATDAEIPVGSLALSDLDEILLKQSPQLRQEVQQALRAVNRNDVGCFALLVYRPFDALNHSRVAPFTCSFASNKFLKIEAKNIAKLPNGETISLTRLLDRKTIPEGTSLQFELTSWKWSKAR